MLFSEISCNAKCKAVVNKKFKVCRVSWIYMHLVVKKLSFKLICFINSFKWHQTRLKWMKEQLNRDHCHVYWLNEVYCGFQLGSSSLWHAHNNNLNNLANHWLILVLMQWLWRSERNHVCNLAKKVIGDSVDMKLQEKESQMKKDPEP